MNTEVPQELFDEIDPSGEIDRIYYNHKSKWWCDNRFPELISAAKEAGLAILQQQFDAAVQKTTSSEARERMRNGFERVKAMASIDPDGNVNTSCSGRDKIRAWIKTRIADIENELLSGQEGGTPDPQIPARAVQTMLANHARIISYMKNPGSSTEQGHE